jgi:hypothetical protein
MKVMKEKQQQQSNRAAAALIVNDYTENDINPLDSHR